MRVNGNLRGLAWAASGGAVYVPSQAAAVPGAHGGGSGGSAYYVPNPPAAAPMPAPAPQIRPVALGPAARPVGAMTLPGASLGPSSSAPAAVVTAPVTDGTSTPLFTPTAGGGAPTVIPWGLLLALLFGST